MRVIIRPTVTVLSLPSFIPHPEYKVPPTDNVGYALIAHAGKGCYDSYGEDGRSIKEHIQALIQSKHGSVLEHVNVSFFIEGISRGLSHELVRHRHFAFSQRSTRYTNEDEAAIVLDPFYARLYNEARYDLVSQFINSCEDAINSYKQAVSLLDATGMSRKWKRGKARQLLPHALETRLTMTGNIRAWRWFIESRSNRHAEAEIRRLSFFIFTLIKSIYPLLFEDFEEEYVDDYPEYTTKYSKI